MKRLPTVNLTIHEVERLSKNGFFNSGAESVVLKTPNPHTLYKLFDYEEEWEPEIVYPNKEAKLAEIYNMQLQHSVLPLNILRVNGKFAGYEMTYDPLDRALLGLELSREQTIETLLQVRNILGYYAERNITYGDVKSSNILINRKTGKPKFCDIDNIRLAEHEMDAMPEVLIDFVMARKQLDADAISDMYMFNLLTLEQLTYPSATYAEILADIESHYPENFGVEAHRILDTMLYPKSYKGESIIQYVKR